MLITYHGHACFSLEQNNLTLLFDPFLSDNPLAKISAQDIKTDYILVSHGHSDHCADAWEIAKKNQATIITSVEIAQHFAQPNLNFHRMNLGGSYKFPFGKVKMTPALHGAGVPGGRACGFVVEFFGQTVYFAGDTGLFGDMQLIGQLNKLNLAFLPIGDNFTMGIDDAVIATKFLQPQQVIPMHYATWPVINANPQEFAEKITKATSSHCLIMQIEEKKELKRA